MLVAPGYLYIALGDVVELDDGSRWRVEAVSWDTFSGYLVIDGGVFAYRPAIDRARVVRYTHND